MTIRDARNAKGLTQTQVAEAMDWSLSKVMRIESGEVSISPNDLRPLLSYLDIRDRQRVDELIQSAKASRQRKQWWDEPRFRESLTPAMRQQIGFEIESRSGLYFCTSFLPGFMQTPLYAAGIMGSYQGDLTPDEIDLRIEARARRRASWLARGANRPDVYLLLDESVMLREVGGRQGLGNQLADLTRLIKDGWLKVKVAPFTGVNPMLATYEILYLGSDHAENGILYRESHTVDEIVDDFAKVARHRQIWDGQWESAIDQTASAKLIEARANELSADGGQSSG